MAQQPTFDPAKFQEQAHQLDDLLHAVFDYPEVDKDFRRSLHLLQTRVMADVHPLTGIAMLTHVLQAALLTLDDVVAETPRQKRQWKYLQARANNLSKSLAAFLNTRRAGQ